MVAEVGAAVHGARMLKDAISSVVSTVQDHKKAIDQAELTTQLLTVQQVASGLLIEMQSLNSEKAELEEEIMRLNQWSDEESAHRLTEIAPGVFAQLDRTYDGPLAGAPKYCASCFEQQKMKSVLQANGIPEPREISLICPSCKFRVTFRHYNELPAQTEPVNG